MGEYHTKFLKGLFTTEQEYQDYIHRKTHISWKKSARQLFSDLYKMENALDSEGIPMENKDVFLDLFVNYAEERRKEISDLEVEKRKQVQTYELKVKKYKQQRNLSFALCACLLAVTLFFFLW